MQGSQTVLSVLHVLIVVCGMRHAARAKLCAKVVPGLEKLRSGVDITKLDLLPVSEFSDNGFLSPIVDYTCNDGATKTIDETTYDVPDQVANVVTETGGQQMSQVQTIKSESQIKNSLSVNAGIGVETGKVGFSGSSSYSEMQEVITKGSRYISQVYAVYGTSAVNLKPSLTLALGESARVHVANLPQTFAANPSAYYQFISTFGTHYFDKGKLGGLFLVTVETDSSYFQKKDDRQVEANVKATFKTLLSAETGTKTEKSAEVTELEEASKVTSRFFGGQTNLASDGLSKWQETIKKSPYFISGSVRPISDLIRDGQRQAAMQEAVKNYLLRAEARDLDRLTHIRVMLWMAGQTTLSSIQSQLNSLKEKQVFTKQDEERLQLIESQVRVPAWFSDRATFCFEAIAKGDPTQCNGQSNNLLCAEPNRMTAPYLDRTNAREGGCSLRWKLSSSENPEWFRSVEIHFRWYSVWSPCACGPLGLPYKLTATPALWTPAYLDLSNPLHGECMLQWRLAVNDSAPVWAQNVHLCVDLPCGPLKECVLANAWTPPYMDISAVGSCSMSWGLKIN